MTSRLLDQRYGLGLGLGLGALRVRGVVDFDLTLLTLVRNETFLESEARLLSLLGFVNVPTFGELVCLCLSKLYIPGGMLLMVLIPKNGSFLSC